MIRTNLPDNPFEIKVEGNLPILYHQGAPALLAGIHVDTELLGTLNNQQIDALMQRLKDKRNNFYRHWLTAYYVFNSPVAKRYSSPFLFTGGSWDLRFYSDSYFSRLRYALSAARQHGIIVQITIFDFTGLKIDGTEGGGPRWSWNPWNAANNINGVIRTTDGNGIPEFLDRSNTTLATLQDAYARQVIYQTREFSNVVYEIINEPVNASDATAVDWADAILNVIAPLIQGRRLVFYNDHTGNSKIPATRGKNVNYWKANRPSYSNLDGVILHGNPNLVDPTQVDLYEWTWGREKLIQLSTDGFAEELPNSDTLKRDDRTWNQNTTRQVLDRRQIYQAESTNDQAAQGIANSITRPTSLTLPPFAGCWDKTSLSGIDFNIRFDFRLRYLRFDPVNDTIREQGRIVSFTDTTFTTRADGQTNTSEFTYTMSDDGRTLSYVSSTNMNASPQVFTRVPFDLEPFLFGWVKIAENPPSPHPRVLLYFRIQNGRNVSIVARDQDNPQNIIDQGDVVQINPESNPPQMIVNNRIGGLITYSYEFFTDAQSIMHLVLTNIGVTNGRRMEFKRTI